MICAGGVSNAATLEKWLAVALIACSAPVAAQSSETPPTQDKRQITVTGVRRSYETSIDRSTYRIGSDVQAANGTIADVLRNIPSVDVDLQGNVSLRGQGNVTILVDGKPTSLFNGPGGGQTLQQIPASQYERVEVMTNPSAAYAAKGSGGIINLITRKSRANGAVATVRGALGTRGRRSTGVSFSDKIKALTFTANANLRRDPQFTTDVDDFTELGSSGVPVVSSHEVTRGVGKLHLWTASAGADLDLNKSDRVSAEIHHTTFVFHSNMISDLAGTDPFGAIVRRFNRNVFLQQNRFDTEGSLSFRHDTQGKGTDVTVSLTYERTLEDNRDRFDNVDVLPTAADLFDNVSRFGRLGRLEAKADLVSPLPNDSSLQAGVDVEDSRDRYQDLGGFGATAAIAAVPQADFTDLFIFRRTVAAAYAIYQRPLGNLTAQVGVRLENEDHHFRHEDGSSGGSQNDARIFPSFHLQWQANKTVDVKASVSTRIQRPGPSDFDTFQRFVDPFHFVAGNPELKPETTISFETGVERKKNKSLESATIYYRDNRNGVTDVSLEINDGVLLATRENLRGSISLGVELVANGPLSKTINYRLSGNIARFTINATNLDFGHRSAMIASGKAGVDWQPSKTDLAQLNMSLTGKQLLPQGDVDPMLLVNLGYRHRLNQRLFGFMTAQDALHTYKSHGHLNTPTLIERSFDSAKTQAAFIGLSYNLGGKSARDPAFDYSG